VQKTAYGFLGLKPSEFWSMQPKDVMIMMDGCKEVQEYEFNFHIQNLRAIRRVAFILSRANGGKSKEFDIMPLPLDNEKKEFKKNPNITEEDIKNRLGRKIK
jgi:hypothetical protein